MKDLYQIIQEAEVNLEEFIKYQVDFGVTSDFRGFAAWAGKAEEVFKYAAILYPKFIKVEGAVVLEEHYTEENWRAWRKERDPISAAAIINHVHIEDYLNRDYAGTQKLEEQLGELLAFFWKMAVDEQFPNDKVVVEYNGDVINIYQNQDSG